MEFSDITKIKVGDQLCVLGTDITVVVQEKDASDTCRPLSVKPSKEIAFGVHPFTSDIDTSSMLEDDICWLYTSVLDVLICNDITPKELKRALDGRHLVTLENLGFIEPMKLVED